MAIAKECKHGMFREWQDCEKCAVEETVDQIAAWIEATTDLYTSSMLAESVRRREWE